MACLLRHFLTQSRAFILLDLPDESLYIAPEIAVPDVGELSVEFILQWRFEIRLAGTVTEQRFNKE
jgi:hypothetical protein